MKDIAIIIWYFMGFGPESAIDEHEEDLSAWGM
jgi:hypothetical protein